MLSSRLLPRAAAMPSPHEAPLLLRLAAKFVLDIMPGALASIIGGFLFTQYQFGHVATSPPLERVQPASAEMMRLVRDEHAMIIDYLNAQAAADRSRLAAEEAQDARADADADAKATATATATAQETAAKAVALRHLAVAALGVRRVAHVKPVAVIARAARPRRPPLVLAQVGGAATPAAAAVVPVTEPAGGAPDSLIAKTLDIKDHVVDATLHMVSAIGSIPSWIAGMGGRRDDGGPISNAGRLFSAAS